MKKDLSQTNAKDQESSGVRTPKMLDPVDSSVLDRSDRGTGLRKEGTRATQRRISEKTGRFRSHTSNMSTVQDFVRPELNKGGDQLRSIRPMPNRQFDTTSTFTMPKPRRKPLKERLTRHGRAKVYRLKGYTSVAGVRRIYHREAKRYRKIRRRIVLLVLLVLIVLLLIWNPFPWFVEFFRALKL